MIPVDDFVVVWQTAETLADVCKKLDLEPTRASERASRLRKRGVPLQYFVNRNIDYDELARLAESVQADPREGEADD
jgi:hypothetical protein